MPAVTADSTEHFLQRRYMPSHPAFHPPTAPIDVLALNTRLHRRNRWQELRSRRRLLRVAIPVAILAVTGSGLLLRAHAGEVAWLLMRALDAPLLVIVAIGWPVAHAVARSRRTARRQAARSWLAALPLTTVHFERHARRRVALAMLGGAVLGSGLLVALATLGGLPLRATVTALLLLATALVAGSALGWTLGARERRTVRRRLPAAGSAARDRRYPLGRWPLRHSHATTDIGLHARAIGAMLLGLPMGVPATAVLCLIVIGLAGFACWDLLRGLLVTATQARAWLRSLPLVPRAATGALGRRALALLTLALCLLALALLPSGIAATTAFPLAILGSVLTTLCFALTCMWCRPFGAKA